MTAFCEGFKGGSVGGADKWNILDRWFVFLAGQIKDRVFLRWLYQRRQLIYEIWFYAAALCSVFYLLFFFGAFDGRHSSSLALDIARITTLNAGGGTFAYMMLVISCLGLGAITPVLVVLVPLALVLLPLFMVGAALWVVVAFITLIVAALAPLGVLFGGRAIFEHYVARWLAEAGQRERERAAVYAALGLNGGASRTVTGGQGGLFQHAAQHMTEEEAAAFGDWKKSSILLGRAYGRPFFTDTPKHLLMVAGTRGGKGRDLIVPNLKIYEGGAFILDPKGENAQKTAKNRATFGDVFALDPFGVSGLPSISFNPLSKLRGNSMIADAQMLADALIIGTDPFFSNAARQLLGGIILHVVTAPESKTTLPTTAKDIELNPHLAPTPAQKRDLSEVLRCLMQKLPETLAAMTQSDHKIAGEFLRNIGEWGLSTADEEWSGVRSSAIISLEWLSAPEMAAAVQDSETTLDFSDYLKKSMTVYVCLPAPMFAKYKSWLRLVVSSALNAMTVRLAPPPLPVRFVLDEVAQLGTLSSIESALTLSAGYGVQLWGIWQHIGDIKRCYPSSGVSGWTSSSGVRMCFATNDNETCDEFAKQSGGVFTPDHIARLSPSEMLVLLDGQNPLIVQRDAMDMVEEPHTFKGGRQEKSAA
jgi:type IV secretory pathway TraG/TraD family ATPase VirD4